MGNQIQAKIDMPGQQNRPGPSRQLTLDIITEWIKAQHMDEYTTNGLIELASRYPTNALPSFRRNFQLMIARVRQKRREEQSGIQETQ
jgi:hypothetical protein